MRDGVTLAADVYAGVEDKPRPALVALSPYGKELQALALTMPPQRRPSPMWDGCIEAGDIARVVAEDYVHVIGDLRGSGDSEGEHIGNYNAGGVLARPGRLRLHRVGRRAAVVRRQRRHDRHLLLRLDAGARRRRAPADPQGDLRLRRSLRLLRDDLPRRRHVVHAARRPRGPRRRLRLGLHRPHQVADARDLLPGGDREAGRRAPAGPGRRRVAQPRPRAALPEAPRGLVRHRDERARRRLVRGAQPDQPRPRTSTSRSTSRSTRAAAGPWTAHRAASTRSRGPRSWTSAPTRRCSRAPWSRSTTRCSAGTTTGSRASTTGCMDEPAGQRLRRGLARGASPPTQWPPKDVEYRVAVPAPARQALRRARADGRRARRARTASTRRR